MSADEREALRRRYLPARVRILFIGESPPAGGRFFYSADSELYRATRDAFYAALGERLREPFLACFAELGCYLDDLCREPVNWLPTQMRRAAHRAGEEHLATSICRLQPQIIIVLLKSIESNVARAAALAECAQIDRHVVTYPSRWHKHRIAYRDQLAALLRSFFLP